MSDGVMLERVFLEEAAIKTKLGSLVCVVDLLIDGNGAVVKAKLLQPSGVIIAVTPKQCGISTENLVKAYDTYMRVLQKAGKKAWKDATTRYTVEGGEIFLDELAGRHYIMEDCPTCGIQHNRRYLD